MAAAAGAVAPDRPVVAQEEADSNPVGLEVAAVVETARWLHQTVLRNLSRTLRRQDSLIHSLGSSWSCLLYRICHWAGQENWGIPRWFKWVYIRYPRAVSVCFICPVRSCFPDLCCLLGERWGLRASKPLRRGSRGW